MCSGNLNLSYQSTACPSCATENLANVSNHSNIKPNMGAGWNLGGLCVCVVWMLCECQVECCVGAS